MPTLEEVYRKFGETAEAAQLLEAELGNMLLMAHCIDGGLLEKANPARAADILDSVNRYTLGQLLKNLNKHTQALDALDALLVKARNERNRLSHSFYREHNFRRNSDEGRAVMLQDLGRVHSALFDAYKAVLALSGVNLDDLKDARLPAKHVRI
jgi:tetratricopeptide (TPR) repeat protein